MSFLSGSFVLSGTWLMLVMSVFQKLISFGVNQLILRNTTPDIIGKANIQMELFLSTVLTISRDGIRLACIRFDASSKESLQSIVNLSWVPTLCTALVSTCLLLFKLEAASIFLLYSLGACFECMGEPLYNFYQSRLEVQPRVFAESVAIFPKSIAIFVSIHYFNCGLLGFGFGQAVYGFAHLAVMVGCLLVGKYNISINQFFPRLMVGKNKWILMDARLLNNLYATFSTTIIKFLLTESDKIALTFASSSYNQGIYAVTSNYAALVTRMLFYPVEEMSRLAFAKSVTELRSSCEGNQQVDGALLRERSSALKALLLQLLRVMGIIGSCFAVFGYFFAPLLVETALQRQWQTAETVQTFSWYLVYMLFLALNGIAEGFVQASAPSSYFASMNLGLVASSAVFVVTSVPLIRRVGTHGIILANALSMTLRIAYNLHLAVDLLSDGRKLLGKGTQEASTELQQMDSRLLTWWDMLPSARLCVSMAVAGAIVSWSSSSYERSVQDVNCKLMHVAVGGAVGLTLLAVVFTKEEFASIVSLIMDRSNKQKTN